MCCVPLILRLNHSSGIPWMGYGRVFGGTFIAYTVHIHVTTIPCLPFRLWPSRCQKHQGSKGRHNESMCVIFWCGESWTSTVKRSAHSEFWIPNSTSPTSSSTKKPKAAVAFRASAKAKGVDALACIQANGTMIHIQDDLMQFYAIMCTAFACSNHSSSYTGKTIEQGKETSSSLSTLHYMKYCRTVGIIIIV